jgi:hypothetical protein
MTREVIKQVGWFAPSGRLPDRDDMLSYYGYLDQRKRWIDLLSFLVKDAVHREIMTNHTQLSTLLFFHPNVFGAFRVI